MCGSLVSFSKNSVLNVFNHLTSPVISPSVFNISYNTNPGFLSVNAPSSGVCGLYYNYQWQVSNNGIDWRDISSMSTSLNYAPEPLTPTSYLKITCGSETQFSGVSTININNHIFPGEIAVYNFTIGANTSPGIIMANPAGGGNCGTRYIYAWQSSTNGTTFTDISGAAGQTYTPGNLNTTEYLGVRLLAALMWDVVMYAVSW